METLLQILASITLLASSFMGGSEIVTAPAPSAADTVEIGLYETSPRGEEGGFAMPASGCSPAEPLWHGLPIHDCSALPDISTDKPIIRLGDPVTVYWNPKMHTNCILSSNLIDIEPLPVNANISDSRVDEPTGETAYTITCDGIGNTDTAVVKVLPRIQET